MELYEWDLNGNQYGMGLRKLHKLKEEHIHLTPSLRMVVKIAAQVCF